jgi:hypothetical protein
MPHPRAQPKYLRITITEGQSRFRTSSGEAEEPIHYRADEAISPYRLKEALHFSSHCKEKNFK